MTVNKKRKPIKRLYLSHEVRDNNALNNLNGCTCECHEPGVFIMHFMACCNTQYSERIELGEYTYKTEKEFSDYVNSGINYFSKELDDAEEQRRVKYWKIAIADTILSKSILNPSYAMVEMYADYIKGKIDLDECIEKILEMVDIK